MKRRRDGFTLVELMVVLTVLSLVWLCITCTLYRLHRADRRLRDDLQREQAIDRLATRLRLDAHEANSVQLVELAERGDELVLSTLERRTIHYGMSDEGVYRIVRMGEAIVHRDEFLIGRATSEWELQSPEDPALVILTLTARDGRTQATRVRHIKAAVASAPATIVAARETSS